MAFSLTLQRQASLYTLMAHSAQISSKNGYLYIRAQTITLKNMKVGNKTGNLCPNLYPYVSDDNSTCCEKRCDGDRFIISGIPDVNTNRKIRCPTPSGICDAAPYCPKFYPNHDTDEKGKCFDDSEDYVDCPTKSCGNFGEYPSK